ncbi:hypothetical protein GOA80_22005 [Sinorhizobium meliloti]|nr:hypothetical protein [Sinorhizobium meliloti]
MTDNQPRYTTKRLHQEISRAKDIARMEALAEAAKIVDDAAADFKKKASTNENPVAHDALLMASDLLELTGDAIRALAISPAPLSNMVASIVPRHCSGYSFVFEPGVLHVKKDGSGYIAVNEDDFVLEDDRDGEGGGSIHWIARMGASEITALRDFLNGAPQQHLRSEVTHEDVCNTHEGGPCNCDWRAADEGEPHPDDLAVDRFAAAMKAKLAKKRDEGRGGWEDKDQCSNAFLSRLLVEHVQKGDPVDVGNLAMMIHQRGEGVGVASGNASAIAQLNAIVDAWEALPGGRQVKNSDVERWLAKHMGPGIDAIRGFLRRPRPDGILSPPPQTREAER